MEISLPCMSLDLMISVRPMIENKSLSVEYSGAKSRAYSLFPSTTKDDLLEEIIAQTKRVPLKIFLPLEEIKI